MPMSTTAGIQELRILRHLLSHVSDAANAMSIIRVRDVLMRGASSWSAKRNCPTPTSLIPTLEVRGEDLMWMMV